MFKLKLVSAALLLAGTTVAHAHSNHSHEPQTNKPEHRVYSQTELYEINNVKVYTTRNEFVTTYQPSDALHGDVITPSGEIVKEIHPDREIAKKHYATHGRQPFTRHTLPPYYEYPTMDSWEDYVITADEMVVINPAPGEYVRIAEGKRHGFQNLTVGITYTQQGGGAPLHTHESEEAHVLLQGKVRYQLGNDVFEVTAPYIINIPPMMPHAFMSLRKKPAEIVVIFPENKWEFDFVEHYNAQDFFTLPDRYK